nr:MAG TPA: hypothetical protein [Caudoviricetes sp.]
MSCKFAQASSQRLLSKHYPKITPPSTQSLPHGRREVKRRDIYEK